LWAAANKQWKTCVSIGAAALDPIEILYSYLTKTEKIDAIYALGAIGDKRALGFLYMLLKHYDLGIVNATRSSIDAIKKRN